MKYKVVLFAFLLSIIFFSCESSKVKKEAEEKTNAFLQFYTKGDEAGMGEQYIAMKKFSSYLKSDSAWIKSSSYKNGIVVVTVHSKFTNGFGKSIERDIDFYYRKGDQEKMVIFDSKGLNDFTQDDYYSFGVKTGCINKSVDTTDLSMVTGLGKSKILMMSKGMDIYSEILRSVKVVNWTWEQGYGGSASGKGIVKNGSTFSIPRVKYKITYNDRSGNEVTSDDGIVSYETIEPGESRSFTFYTGYVGNASNANINLEFDEKVIINYLNDRSWTGNECYEYFYAHPEKLKEL